MKVTTDTGSMTKHATFKFNGETMHVCVALDQYRNYNDKHMHEDANYQLHHAIEGFLRGQIQHVLIDARKAMGM